MLRDYVPYILWSWVAAAPVLFRVLPRRDAMLAVLVGGWALLPNGPYPLEAFRDPLGQISSMPSLALPIGMFPNKAFAVGLACAVGIVLCDWRALLRLRPVPADLPMVVWCLVPAISTATNGLSPLTGLGQVAYLVVAWGLPYVAGRLYLTDEAALRRFAAAMALGGLAYGLPCLVEWGVGPFLYDALYGPHPYLFEGARRPLGFRPLVLLEHGNQLGMWLASAAVAGAWLAGSAPSKWSLAARLGAAALVALALIGQSHASLAFMLIALVPLAIPAQPDLRRAFRVFLVAVALLAVVAAIYAVPMLARDPGRLRGQVRAVFHGIGKSSLTWRLARSEEFLPRALERPLAGWCVADWSPGPDGEFVNPVNLGLWLLALGRYGILGLAASTAVLVVPIVRSLWRRWPRDPLRTAPGAVLATLLLAMNAADSLSNSVLILPIVAVAGGLSTRSGFRPSPGGTGR